MLYKNFKGLSISALGLGCMRFPIVDGDNSKIDYEMTEKIVTRAMDAGVNYYDTAWGYHEQQSEIVIGKLLSEYPRESFYLASKFPGYDPENLKSKETVFARQLEKCQTEYFDFYLLHNVNEQTIDGYLDPETGLFDFMKEQVSAGRIRHLGFSTHGSCDTMRRFLDVFRPIMEFCQIQLNYIDWTFQDAKAKMALLREENLPVWVMEPVRGGKLAKLEPEYLEVLKKLRPEASAPEWAFRFIQSLPDIVVTLSGMTELPQVEENIRIFSEEKPLAEREMDTLLAVADEMLREKNVPCTACRYCTAYCPQEIEIPELLRFYNEHGFTISGISEHIDPVDFGELKHPDNCIACRSCEAVCPQQIEISARMKELARASAY